MQISFIGLGAMGGGMARNLSKYGGDFIVCDIDPEKLKPFQETGIATVTDAKDVASADVICICVHETKDVDGLIRGVMEPFLRAGQVIMDFSTISYNAAADIAKWLDSKGVGFLDAPVSGGKIRANNGTLTIMVGGKPEVYAKMEPYIKMMGNTILYMGPSGSGQIAKTINGTMYKLIIAGFSELMPLAVKMGLDPEQLERMINTGVAASDASHNLLPKTLNDDFIYATLPNGYKDLVEVREMCRKQSISLPTVNGAIESYELAMKDYPDLYFNAMIKTYEKKLSIQFRHKKAN